ncbi:MAG TPA: SDR family oxidoreductase, partial [Blastocatellia bacterium]|nr:SDR family oxidoreductase [Blastocatellia bacterium]
EDAIHLVAKRGLIIESLDEGAMLAVAMPEMELRQLLSRDLSVAAVNTASLCVVSGPEEDTKAFEALLERKGILSRRVEAAHAFHSTMMDAGSGRLVAEARNIKLSAPAIPYISNVTGTWISDSQARDPGYWGRHMCETVRFDDGITQLLKTPERILLEVGPGRSLGSHAVQHPAIKGESQVVVLSTLPHSYERVSEEASVLKAVGRLWLAGIEPNWAGFHGEERRHKVTLPSYPFERTTHWVDARPAAPIADERPADIGWISDIADWFSVPSWKRKLSRRDHGNEARRRGRHLLVFAGDGPLCTLLMRRLEEDGQNVMVVRSADRFSRLSDNLYQIDPSKPKDYERLIGDLIRTNRSPAQIIHLWSVTGTVQASDQEVFDRVQTLGFYSLLFLAQALAKHELATGMVDRSKECLRVEVVSDEMQSVIGDEDINPEKATLLGPCKTIPQEYPSVICRSIDIAVPAPESSRLEKVVERLFDEITGPPDDLVVAYRGNNRWVEYYEPIRIEKSSREPALLRERGVYLFTGGLGRDGLVRAKYLAQNFRARLILTGRTGLPPKDEWLSYLAAHGGDDRTSDRIRKVLEIEELGSEVEVVKADVGSEVDMRRVMKLADERFGRLDGVIHSAGVAEFAGSVEFSKTVAELSRGDCERHFQPKVHGCYVIEKVLQGRALDFCILTSSIASITSGIGVLAYTAASIFLDAFAHKHNQKGPVWWMSVNWQGVSPEDTVEGFRRMLSIGAPIPQLVVSPEDLEASINRRIKLDFLRAAMPAGVTLHSRPKLGTPFVAPRNGAEQGVVDLWRQLLGIDEIGVNDNFLELGADSLLAVQFVSRVRTAFNVTASLRDVFEAPTAADFALVIEELVIREIDALTEEEAKTLTREERVHGPAALSPSEAKT